MEEEDWGIRKSLQGKTSAPIPGAMPRRQLLQHATHQASYNFPPGDKDPPTLRGQPQTPPQINRKLATPELPLPNRPASARLGEMGEWEEKKEGGWGYGRSPHPQRYVIF